MTEEQWTKVTKPIAHCWPTLFLIPHSNLSSWFFQTFNVFYIANMSVVGISVIYKPLFFEGQNWRAILRGDFRGDFGMISFKPVHFKPKIYLIIRDGFELEFSGSSEPELWIFRLERARAGPLWFSSWNRAEIF